jgi:hypothetical protein
MLNVYIKKDIKMIQETSSKIASIVQWINDKGREPKRSSSDKEESSMARFIANMRTSKKNCEAGENGKPLHWSDAYIELLITGGVRADLFEPSNIYAMRQKEKLQSVLKTISTNGEGGNETIAIWLSGMRKAKADNVPPWDSSFMDILRRHNSRTDVPVRVNLFDVHHTIHNTNVRLDTLLRNMKLRMERGGRAKPRTGILTRTLDKGTDLSEIERQRLADEESDAQFLNSIRAEKKKGNPRRYHSGFETHAERYGFYDLF